VTDETIFEAASLTKPVFAYYVMLLVDQGILDLDEPLLGYVPRDLVEEALATRSIGRVPARLVREDHGAARAEPLERHAPWRDGQRPPLFFEPGTQWKYSAEGYYMLQRVVEALKRDKLENLMQAEVFDPLGMSRSRMVWRDDYEGRVANGHSFFGTPEDVRRRTESARGRHALHDRRGLRHVRQRGAERHGLRPRRRRRC